MFSMTLKPPPSLDDMVALPPFIDPDAPKGKEDKEMRERSLARTKSVAAMPGKDTSVFKSKGWDALFQAAQDVDGLREKIEEEEREALEAAGGVPEASHATPWRNNTKAAAPKAVKPKKPRGMDELYLLLDETPEETAAREKRLRERRETLLALRDEERKKWMTKHGRVVRPTLDDAMKLQLRQAFDLIDQDGSGAIDVDELEEAFKVLGMKVGRREVEEMMDEVDEDKSGEVELPEFEQIMTKQIMADPDSKGGTGGAVPFHVIATSYRRKRLLDAIISGDKQAMKSMIEKAELYRELEEAAQEGQRGDYFWITTKVAFMIRGWIRRWKAKKIAEMHQRKIGFADEVVDTQKDTPSPPPPPPPVVFEAGGRDMGLRVGERQIDNRTMEKIRMRAKLASIVNVFDAHEQLDEHSHSTDKAQERNDLRSIQGDLRSIITSRVADHKQGLEKRMLLAATAQNRLRSQSSRRLSVLSRDSYTMAPSDIRQDVQLSPRGQAVAALAERLSQSRSGKNKGAVTKACKSFWEVADRRAAAAKFATALPKLPALEGHAAATRKRTDGSSSSPTRENSRAPLSAAAADEERSDDDDEANSDGNDRSARLEKQRAKLRAVKLHGSKKQEDPRWIARASSTASAGVLEMQRSASDLSHRNKPKRESSVDSRMGRSSNKSSNDDMEDAPQRRFAELGNHIHRQSSIAEEEEGEGEDMLDEEVRHIMESANAGQHAVVDGNRGKGSRLRPHTMPTPDVRVQMRYLPIYRHSLAQSAERGKGSRQRRTPVPSSLNGLIPAAVLHSPATTEQAGTPPVHQRSQTLSSAASSRRGGSPAPPKRSNAAVHRPRQQRCRSISPSAQHHLQLQDKAGAPKASGPTNGVRPSTWRSSRSAAAHSPTPAIYPTYVPSKSGAHAVRSISPAPARQFLAVMRQSMPHTPNAHFQRSHGLELESTFLSRAEF